MRKLYDSTYTVYTKGEMTISLPKYIEPFTKFKIHVKNGDSKYLVVIQDDKTYTLDKGDGVYVLENGILSKINCLGNKIIKLKRLLKKNDL
jgi:hypothetical protein